MHFCLVPPGMSFCFGDPGGVSSPAEEELRGGGWWCYWVNSLPSLQITEDLSVCKIEFIPLWR